MELQPSNPSCRCQYSELFVRGSLEKAHNACFRIVEDFHGKSAVSIGGRKKYYFCNEHRELGRLILIDEYVEMIAIKIGGPIYEKWSENVGIALSMLFIYYYYSHLLFLII